MHEAEDPGWSRTEWARWFLEHDEVDEAARVLQPGDELAVTKIDFRDLAAALGRRGLAALYEDGCAFVYTPEEARAVQTKMAVEAAAASERRPATRSSSVFTLSHKKVG